MLDRVVVSNKANRFREGLLLGIGAYLIWGLVTLFWKQLVDFEAGELIGWRISMSFLTLAILMVWHGGIRSVTLGFRAKRTRGLVIIAALVVVVNWSSYILAVVHDHLIEAALGYFLSPLGTVTLGVLVMGERLRSLQYLIVALATAASVVISVSYGQVPWIALLIAGSWSIYSLIKRQLTVPAVESLAMEMVVLVFPAIALVVVLSPNTDSVWHVAGAWQWVLIVLTGPVTVAPLWMFGAAAQRLPMTQLGPLQYIVPVINFLLGWLVYDEAVTVATFAGFALIWLALVVLALDLGNETRKRAKPESIRL